MKPLKIDWEELDEAFHNQNDELVYFLDLVTGHVVLEGEGSEDIDPEDDDPVAPVQRSRPGDRTRAYVEPPDTPRKIRWMERFIEDVRADPQGVESEAIDGLVSGLQDPDPARALKAHLNQNPDLRDRWYLYRSDRIHEMIYEWLQQHRVSTIGTPPWDSAD